MTILITEDVYLSLLKNKILVETVLTEKESKDSKKPLNKPIRTPNERKKYKVYTTDPKTGKTVTVRYGDPNMKIKRQSDSHRKNFRARHGCDGLSFKKDRATAKYWSCRNWEKNRPAGT